MFGIIASALAPLIVDKLSKLEKGGDVKKTGAVIVHKGEYMLPKGVKPTKAQRKAVAKGKAKKTAPKKTAPKKTAPKKTAPKKKRANLKRRVPPVDFSFR